MIKKGKRVVFKGGCSFNHLRVWLVKHITKDGKRISIGRFIDGGLWHDVDKFRLAEPDEIKNKKRRDA